MDVIGIAGAYWALHYSSEYVKPNELTYTYYAFSGVIITTLFSNLASIYVAVKTVDAGMDFTRGLFNDYHTNNALSCFLGIYEMGFIILNMVWSTGISFTGYYMAYAMYKQVTRVADLGKNDGIKYLVLGLEMAAGAWIAGLALGEQAAQTVGYFDNYPTATTVTGESMMFDLAYHSLTSLVVYIAMTAISYGGYWIAFNWLDKGDNDTVTTYAKC